MQLRGFKVYNVHRWVYGRKKKFRGETDLNRADDIEMERTHNTVCFCQSQGKKNRGLCKAGGSGKKVWKYELRKGIKLPYQAHCPKKANADVEGTGRTPEAAASRVGGGRRWERKRGWL